MLPSMIEAQEKINGTTIVNRQGGQP